MMKYVVAIFLLTTTVYMNYYKFDVMYNIFMENVNIITQAIINPRSTELVAVNYKIYPWSEIGQISKSTIEWLYTHNACALMLSILSLWLWVCPPTRDSFLLTVHLIFHYLFLFQIWKITSGCIL